MSAKVANGIALLREKNPDGLAKLREPENLEKLSVGSVRNCPLGLIYGDYLSGKRALGFSLGSQYGFNVFIETKSEDLVKEFRTLTREWKKQLLAGN